MLKQTQNCRLYLIDCKGTFFFSHFNIYEIGIIARCSLFGKAYFLHAKLLQSCPTLCDPMDCSLPGFSEFQVKLCLK